MEFAGNASIITRNATGDTLGGALCGGYSGQTLTVRDNATIDVADSHSRLYGGAIMAHNSQHHVRPRRVCHPGPQRNGTVRRGHCDPRLEQRLGARHFHRGRRRRRDLARRGCESARIASDGYNCTDKAVTPGVSAARCYAHALRSVWSHLCPRNQ